MTSPQACTFLVVGLGMVATPAFQTEHFANDQMKSAIWLVFMGGLLATGGLVFLLNEGMNHGQRVFAMVSESLNLDLDLADIRRTVLPPSFYALLEEPEEVTQAWQLQQQLRPGA